MKEQEYMGGFRPEQNNDLWEQARCERRVLKHAIKGVYDRCARKEILACELGVEIRRVFAEYVEKQFSDPDKRVQLQFSSNGYDLGGLRGRYRQGLIDHIMFLKFDRVEV